MDSLVESNSILWTGPMFLPEASIGRLRSVTLRFGLAYQILREEGRVHNMHIFPVRGKVHKMQHVPMMAEIINPALVQYYADESQIGTTVKIWKRSMRGRYSKFVQRNVLIKRLVGLFLRLEH